MLVSDWEVAAVYDIDWVGQLGGCWGVEESERFGVLI